MTNKPQTTTTGMIGFVLVLFAATMALFLLPVRTDAKEVADIDHHEASLTLFVDMLPATAFTSTSFVDTVNDDGEPLKDMNALLAAKAVRERTDRINRINAYFEKRDMPLAGYGEEFVKAAEQCDMDWRLLPAIGVRESSGGKRLMNKNPFGWGSAKIPFKDFSEAIDTVAEHLCGLRPSTARYYKDKTVMQKLWYYNGSVMPSYPQEVVDIMNMF